LLPLSGSVQASLPASVVAPLLVLWFLSSPTFAVQQLHVLAGFYSAFKSNL
jgi:hypothetical protein